MVSRKRRRLDTRHVSGDQYYCGHCGENVGRSTFFDHKRKYYNNDGTWKKKDSTELSTPCDGLFAATDPFEQSSSDEENDGSPTNGPESDAGEDSAATRETEDSTHASSSTSGGFYTQNVGNQDTLEDEPEIWDEFPEEILHDLENPDPLPYPQSRSSKLSSLLEWFVLFILLWQANCKISNNGLEWLLQFLFQFLHLAGVSCNSEYLIQLSLMFPTSVFLLHKFVNLDKDNFQKFVVCPDCATRYDPGDCTYSVRGRTFVKTCSHRAFRKGKASRECGAKLAKKVTLGDGSERFYPVKVYCYRSVINQIEAMLKRPGYPEKCEHWRTREQSPDIYADIYDGQVWKDFLRYKGKDFLNATRSLAFALNVDWFQPFTRRTDVSVGVIYLVNLNLPRDERFKWENVILVGIIPDMEKIPKSINSFLEPMVEEFKILWGGIHLQSSRSNIPLLYRAAILCAASDIPAARKLCGFKGHNANRACSKCFKFFPGSVKKGRDFSGFSRELWPLRNNSTHRRYAYKVKNAATRSSYDKLSTLYGCYYSILLELPYFDAVKFTVIDPMHNLFLGTAKTVFKLWLKKNILTKAKQKVVEEKVKKMDVGTGFGRLPHKISANYGGYTASQWKNWTTIYSLYALHGVIPEPDLNCWHTFVMACRLLTVPVLTKTNLMKADYLFIKFGKQFQQLYGRKCVTVNMHLHCHLKDCVKDYGPVYSFWCFAFERFNGILGATTTNNRSVEMQIMRKFVCTRFVWDTRLPADEFSGNFTPFFKCYNDSHSKDNTLAEARSLTLFSLACDSVDISIQWADIPCLDLPKAYKLMHLDLDDRQLLAKTYSYMYPGQSIGIDAIGVTARRYTSVTLAGEKFGSKLEHRSLRSARVMASWAGDDGEVNSTAAIRPGQVKFYILHNLKNGDEYCPHVFACMQWYTEDIQKEKYRRPVEIWKLKEFDNPGAASFLPVQRLFCKFAAVEEIRTGKLIISPILRTFC